MLTDFARDHAFTIAWFGLMALVWFGWGQEDPPRKWRGWLGAGSALGVAFAAVFGFGVYKRWDAGTAMEGNYGWFGALVAVELILAGAGCILLSRTGRSRWMAWWVALVVALHFVPLAFILADTSLVLLGLIQVGGLLALLSRLRATEVATSRLVGPWMGLTLLAFAALSCLMFVTRTGAPW